LDEDHLQRLQPYNPLTRRERDILMLLAQGLTDREIAEHLVVSYNTVKWYNRQIFNKLGVENRREAINHAFTRQLHKPPAAVQPSLHNLPAKTTRFIGRVGELQKLTRLLVEESSRLITLFAPGGMGKTRLALAAAEACLPHFKDGVFFVSLAGFLSPDQLIPAIADAIGFQFTSGRETAQQQVLKFLHDKHLLLVLDNFEHLLEAASLLTNLLERAAHLHILVTSRERLNLNYETLYALGGMRYPETLDTKNALDYAAVQLFLECGQRIAGDNVHSDIASIVHICQLIQGMPLAIELAAAWLVALSPKAIADEIAQGLDFLQTTMRNLPDRHRSVRAVFESTWQRLTVLEQQVFSKLSVFRGGFKREAAQVIGGADASLLMALTNKALITRSRSSDRYEIHELLRQFGEAHLQQAGNDVQTRDKHAAYFANFLTVRLPILQSQQSWAVLDEIEQDFENIREAISRLLNAPLGDDHVAVIECLRQFFEARVHVAAAVHHPGLPYTSLRLYFEARAHFSADAIALFRKALQQVHSDLVNVQVQEGLGDALQVMGDYQQARQVFQQAQQLLPDVAFVLQARLLRKQALTFDAEKRLEQALQVLAETEETLKRSTSRDQAWWKEWIETQLRILSAYFFLEQLQLMIDRKDSIREAVERYGTAAQRFDFYVTMNALLISFPRYRSVDGALEYAQLGLKAAYEAGGPLHITLAHIRAGITYLVGEEWAASEQELIAGLNFANEVGNILTQAICLMFLAYVCRRRGQVEQTQHWAQQAVSVTDNAGIDVFGASAKASLAWVAWRTRDVEQAFALAHDALNTWQRVAPKYPAQWQALWITLGFAVERDQLQDAVKYARQLLDKAQLHPRQEAAVHLQAALGFWEMGDTPQCCQAFAAATAAAVQFGYL
jgi:predicted ATPase/DNA-binding CsgD family transcriptional regulator